MKVLLGLFLIISIPATATLAETAACTSLGSEHQSQLDAWPNTTDNVVREFVEKRSMDYEIEMRFKKNLVKEPNKISWSDAEKMIRMGMVFRVLVGNKNVTLLSTSGYRYETKEPKYGAASRIVSEIDPCGNWISLVLP